MQGKAILALHVFWLLRLYWVAFNNRSVFFLLSPPHNGYFLSGSDRRQISYVRSRHCRILTSAHFTWTSFSSMIFSILVLCVMMKTVYVNWIKLSPLIAIKACRWIGIFIRWLVCTWCFVLYNNRGIGFMRAFHI